MRTQCRLGYCSLFPKRSSKYCCIGTHTQSNTLLSDEVHGDILSLTTATGSCQHVKGFCCCASSCDIITATVFSAPVSILKRSWSAGKWDRPLIV
eukprot:43396-Eustigmatos_ZCMA.PRE.1